MVDRCIYKKIVNRLIDKGYNAYFSEDILGEDATDHTIAKYAQENGLIVITSDKDFGQIYENYKGQHLGYVKYEFPRPLSKQVYINHTDALIQYIEVNNIQSLYGQRIIIDKNSKPNREKY